MGSHTEGLLNKLPALATCLCGEARVDSYDLMSSVLSFGLKDIEKCAPTGVYDALGKVMVLDHITDSQIFHHNALIAFSIGFSRLEMMVTTLPIDLQV